MIWLIFAALRSLGEVAEPSLCFHFLINSLLQSLIHQGHALDQQVLCLACFLHNLEIFIKSDEILLKVPALHLRVGGWHVNPEVKNTIFTFLSGFLVGDLVFEGF